MLILEYGKKTDPNIWSDLQIHLYLSIFRDKSDYAVRVEYVGPRCTVALFTPTGRLV